jgi:HEAT repeat protein
MRKAAVLMVGVLLGWAGVAPAAERDVKRAVAEQVRRLADPDPLVRQDAADALADLGPAAADAATGLLRAVDDPPTRWPAALALARVSPPAALSLALHHRDEGVQRLAADALATAGPAAVPALAAVLRDRNPSRERGVACKILGRIGPGAAEAVPLLARELEEWDPRVVLGPPLAGADVRTVTVEAEDRPCREAAEALGRIGPAAVPALVRVARVDGRIRWHVVRGLCGQGDTLWAHWGEELRKNAWVGAVVVGVDAGTLARASTGTATAPRVEAVGALGDVRPLPPEAARTLTALVRDPDEAVCVEAVIALGKGGVMAPAAADSLLEELPATAADFRAGWEARGKWFVEVTRALRGMGGAAEERLARKALPVLSEALGDPDRSVREAALWWLAEIGPRAGAAVPVLARELDCDPLCMDGTLALNLLKKLGPAAVPALTALLRHPEPFVRAAAARSLGEFGPAAEAALPALLAAARAADGKGRAEALVALGGLRNQADNVVPTLRDALRDPETRRAAMHGLRRLAPWSREAREELDAALGGGDPVGAIDAAVTLNILAEDRRRLVRALTQLLDQDDPEVAESATGALEEVNPELAAETLLRLAGWVTAQGNERERARAEMAYRRIVERSWLLAPADRGVMECMVPSLVEAVEGGRGPQPLLLLDIDLLGMVGPAAERAVPALVNELGGDYDCAAAQALAGIGKVPKEAIPALAILLRDRDWQCRAAAARALAHAGAAARPFLPRLRRLREDPVGAVRPWAVYALRRLTGDEKRHLPDLLQALHEPATPGERRAAAEALGEIGAEAAVPALAEALRDAESGVRHEAAEALGKFGPRGKPAVPGLVALLKEFPLTAAQALGEIGPEARSAVPALEELLGDESDQVASVAAASLKRIRGDRGTGR